MTLRLTRQCWPWNSRSASLTETSRHSSKAPKFHRLPPSSPACITELESSTLTGEPIQLVKIHSLYVLKQVKIVLLFDGKFDFH